MKRFLLPILVLLSSLSAWCQYANVSATLTDGTGSFAPTAYLHFSLRNCGRPQEGLVCSVRGVDSDSVCVPMVASILGLLKGV
jgi:hypothetical protein